MLIEKIEQNLVKVSFSPNEEDVFIGDLLEISCDGKKGVLAQVISIVGDEDNSNNNLASAKTLYTITEDGQIDEWQGNVPGKDFDVNRIPPEEIPGLTNTAESTDTILSKELSGYPDVLVNISASAVNNLTIVAGDKEPVRNTVLEAIAGGLAQNNKSVLLVDFNGEFSGNENAAILKAGKDVKLPLDLPGLEMLYNKTLSDVSAEIKAGIENIFSEIEEYLDSGEAEFLPFKAFMNAVREENAANGMPELELLVNSLAKLHKKGIFADGQKETAQLFREFNNNNYVILDLSGINREWKASFVDFIIKSAKLFKDEDYILLDADKYLQSAEEDPADVYNMLINNALKAEIKPVYALGHRSPLMSDFSTRAENLFVLSPLGPSEIAGLTPYLARISPSDMLVSGTITGNIPLYVKLQQTKPTERQAHSFVSAFAVSESAGTELVEDIPQEESAYEDYESYQGGAETTSQYDDETALDYLDEETAAEYEEASSEDEETQEQSLYDYSEEQPDEKLSEEGEYAEEYSTGDYQSEEDEESEYKEEYDESESSYDVPRGQEANDNREFSDDDLKGFVDLDDEEEASEEAEESYYTPQGTVQSEYESDYEADDESEEDEMAYYETSEEFQDESMLDYAVAQDDETGDETSYYSSEEADESAYYQPQTQEEDEASYYEEGEIEEEADNEDDTSGYYQPNPQYAVSEEENDEYNLSEFMDEEETPAEEDEEEYVPQPVEEPAPTKPKKAPKAKKSAKMPGSPAPNLPVYNVPEEKGETTETELAEGDTVRHKKYGIGVVKKIIGYSEKKLCSIQFEEVGRRLLDPRLAGLEKVVD